ncbi:helix-turn-helix transcriptional regulator [Sporosarcina koreensis]|uniref:Helix-turn-helix transcriptional regulator n=1 Tax=Sporosarcina koreensis TaxID=334735 RepID=A0ABW0TTN6_9BACL
MKNLIKEMRTEMGFTQDDLAEKLEVSRQTIISLEKGRYNPSLILAFKIARLFNCRIEDIFQPEEE